MAVETPLSAPERWALALGLVVSLWVHVLALGVWRYAAWDFLDHPPAGLSVPLELGLDAPEPAGAQPEALGAHEAGEPASQAAGEETISLESKAPRYASYLHQVRARIREEWAYPPEAAARRLTGRLSLVFTLEASGRLARAEVTEPSGEEALDEAALRAVRAASPYPPFPARIRLGLLNIRAVFDYRFEYVQVR